MSAADRATQPNILFVFPDQHRPDWVGYDGDIPVRTPTLDGLVERGTAFANAVCPSPICGPSRACLASGREYDTCGVRDHDADYPLAAPTLYGRLRDAGYHVMGTGKFDIQKHSSEQGIDGKNNLRANGFSGGVNSAGKWNAIGTASDGTPGDPYTKYLADEGLLETHLEDFERRRDPDLSYHEGVDVHATFPTPLPDHAYSDNFVGRKTVDLLRDAPDDQPWFMQVNFVGPHNPWDVTEDMHGWYRDPDVTFPDPVDPEGRLSEDKHQEVRRNYAAMIENIDRWLDRFLDVLEERGEREDTLVVFAADHGELLGDHGHWYKQFPYQSSAGVPLAVAGPGVAERGLVDPPATILDLHATFLDYAGRDPQSVDAAMDSRSMRAYLAGETTDDDAPADGGPREVVYSGFGPWRFAFDGRHKFIRGFDPERHPQKTDAWDETEVRSGLQNIDPVLFDLGADPHELSDVADANPEVVARLDDALHELRPI
jgi:arylsulfatase A-like enzyme